MNAVTTVFNINKRHIELDIAAENIGPGPDCIQFLEDESPVKYANWIQEGFVVSKFLSTEDFLNIKKSITAVILSYLEKLNIDTTGFVLEKYHEFVSTEQHLALIDQIRAGSSGTGGISFEYLGVPTELLDKEASKICNTAVTCEKIFTLQNNKTYKVGHFFVRIVRPGTQKDNNPPHKDTYITHLKNAVNLYYPIVGSDENSSLPILPGSHLWSEKDIVRTHGNTTVNGVKYNVPAVLYSTYGLRLITPNPKYGEAMFFTPYAIHGGGINFNTDTTRMSLEIRFWKV